MGDRRAIHRYVFVNSDSSTPKRTKTVAAIAVGVICIFGVVILFRANEFNWKKIHQDLEIAEYRLWPRNPFAPRLTLLRTSRQLLRVGVIRAQDFGELRSSVRHLSNSSRAAFAINANFFDEIGSPLGLVISRGTIHKGIHHGGGTLTGILKITRESIEIVDRDSFSFDGVIEAIQAGPRLLSNGESVVGLRDTTTYSRRSGVCIDSEKRLVFFITSGVVGMTIDQLTKALQARSINCIDALNLDGGGSAQMYLSDSLSESTPELAVMGSDRVPVVLGLFLRPPADYPITPLNSSDNSSSIR